MTAIRPSAFDSFLRKPDPAIAGLLVYGEEPGAVRDFASRAVAALAGAVDDPFAVATLQDGEIAGDPGRLLDEVQSQSMFGGRRVVWVRDGGDGLAKAAGPALALPPGGNVIVAEAGVLGKSSPLRQLFEKSDRALVLPLYEAGAGEAAGLAEQLLAQQDLKIDADALHRFVELAGTSRSIVQREAEKLGLYCLGAGRATLADVEAVCGNDTGAEPDALIDCVFEGDVPQTDRLFQTLLQAGTDAGRIASAAHFHVQRLQEFRTAIERGMQAEQAIRAARPPVFFKRVPKFQLQLRTWPLDDLVKAGATLGQAVLQVRQNVALGDAIASRCLLSLARRAQALRQGRD